jgi:hypothetical protein
LSFGFCFCPRSKYFDNFEFEGAEDVENRVARSGSEDEQHRTVSGSGNHVQVDLHVSISPDSERRGAQSKPKQLLHQTQKSERLVQGIILYLFLVVVVLSLSLAYIINLLVNNS